MQAFALHSITKLTKDPLAVFLCDGLDLWCVLVMHHPKGIKENGQHDLDITADLPSFFFGLGDVECFHCDNYILVSGSQP